MISAGKALRRDKTYQYEKVCAGTSLNELHTPPRLTVDQGVLESGVSLNRTDLAGDLPQEFKAHRLLSREEEQVLTFQVRDQKKLCELLLFQSPRIIQLALQELRTLTAPTRRYRSRDRSENGTEPTRQRAFKVIMLEPGKGRSKGGQAAAIKRVTLNLKTVEKLVDRIESLVGIFVDPSVSDGERKRARVEFGARRERVATLLSECRFRRAVFKRFESEFTQQALEAQSKKFSSEQHLANFWESQSDLSDRLRQVKMHSDTYEQAREKLVSYNLRLALKLAGERANDHIPFDDLFQSGITGLCEAIDLFEPDRGLKLSTYATYWIMQKMQLCERDLRDLIYRNAYTEALCSSVSSFIGDFVDANGCEPSVKQIASGLRMKEELVLSIQGILTPTVSIDASRTRAKGEDRPSSKIISAAELDLPHEVDRGIEVERLREALVSLPYRQRICIEPRHNLMSSEEKEKLMQYYGVSIDVDPSFGEIGKLFKVTNQRIKQVYGQGLANLLSKLHGIPWVSEGEVKDVIERFNSLSRDMQPTRKSYPI